MTQSVYEKLNEDLQQFIVCNSNKLIVFVINIA